MNIQNHNSKNFTRGFTVIELLIVIVVIAILTAITAFGYQEVQKQSRDAQRAYDATSIEKALVTYRAENSSLPSHTTSSWETSTAQPTGQFIRELSDKDAINEVPVDPLNDSSHYYRYYRYPAGYAGCDVSRGYFVVFQIIDFEDSSRPAEDSPGFSCSGRDWSSEADYVFGMYLD